VVLGTVRFLGAFLLDPLEVPSEVRGTSTDNFVTETY
jgi:hypothetical protein